MKKRSIIILLIFFLYTCGPDRRSLEFRNSQISGIVDSTIYYKPLSPKKFFFSVENRWYVVPATFYGYFINYINKGDSLCKASGRWDIYAYKKKNGRYVEKYFKGAQESWK